METKRCTGCRQKYPATDEFFRPNKQRNNHLGSRCKQCRSEAKQRWREKNRDKDRAASLRWQKNHPEKANARNKRYRDRHPDKMRTKWKRYHQEHPERLREATQRWRLKHLDQAKEKDKRYRDANRPKFQQRYRDYYRADPEKAIAKTRQWQKANPLKVRTIVQRRRARKRQVASTFTPNDWQRALEYWHGCCAYCGNPPKLWDNPRVLHQDHFVPLSKGGAYTPDNILPACQECNISKYNNDPVEWIIRHLGKTKAKKKLIEIQSFFDQIVESHS